MWKRIGALPIVGNIVGNIFAYFFYYVIRLANPLLLYPSGYRRFKRERCIFWVPKKRIQIVLEGIAVLKARDEEMYVRLINNRLVFYYSQIKVGANNGGRVYGLHERYCAWGPDGVATLLVQSLLFYEAHPSENGVRVTEEGLAAIRAAPKKVFEWMRTHGIRTDFVDAYRDVVDAEEKKYAIGRFVIDRKVSKNG